MKWCRVGLDELELKSQAVSERGRYGDSHISVSNRGSRDTVVVMVWSLLVSSMAVACEGHEYR